MIKPEDFTAKVIRIDQVNDKVKVLFFECDKDFNYQAGQFVNLKFEDPFGEQGLIQRAYSIASVSNGKVFELCVEIIEGGRGSTYINNLQVGNEVKMKAPFGFCCIKEDNKNDLVMVGTGTGIAPIKAILEELAAKNDERRIDVFFGVRHETDLFYMEELSDLEANLTNMNLHVTLSQPQSEEWSGLSGRVTTHLEEFDFGHMPDVYLCGGMAMIKDVMKIAQDNGIERKKIHVEIFDV